MIYFVNFACKETVPVAGIYPISHVSIVERDGEKIYYSWGDNGVSHIRVLNLSGAEIASSSISYLKDGMSCSMFGVNYKFFFDNTSGGLRVTKLEAMKGGALFYSVDYGYDEQGRIGMALLEKSGESEGDGDTRIDIYYHSDKVEVSDNGINGGFFTIPLSSEDNTGNVCNVVDFSGSQRTSEYIFNYYFYYMNIFGKPVDKLPAVDEIVREDADNASSKLLKVGKYSYSY